MREIIYQTEFSYGNSACTATRRLILSAPPSHSTDGEAPEGKDPQGGDANVPPANVAVGDVEGLEVLVSVRVSTVSTVGLKNNVG